jgi:hypothetical protein
MRRVLAILISFTLLAPGFAGAGPTSSRQRQSPAATTDRALMVTYLTQLPIGARVRATLTDGDKVSGTLMAATDEGIVVQRRTRIPEPPTRIPLDRIGAVEIENGSGLGKAVGAGVAAGAGAALGVFLLLVALLAD